jgi:hypothetical protein
VEFIECQDEIRRQLRTLMRPQAFTPRVTGIVVLLFVVLTVCAGRTDAQVLRYVVRADPFEVQLTLPRRDVERAGNAGFPLLGGFPRAGREYDDVRLFDVGQADGFGALQGQATLRNPSSSRTQRSSWFQLAKFRLTSR